MKCVICKQGETQPGAATVTREREGTMLIVRSVPAQVCQNCGEEYINEDITATLLQQAEEAVRTGVQVNIRTYVVTQV
jgi:YgiT-type zinc finger domain-containing protein